LYALLRKARRLKLNVLGPDVGGVFQQAASGLSTIPSDAFETSNGWITYAVECKSPSPFALNLSKLMFAASDAPSNTGSGYVYWMQDGKKTWKLTDVDLAAE
jgi:hypothetical protein